jgi:hypothetical protein
MGTPKRKRTKMDGLPQINPDAAGIDVGNAQHWERARHTPIV